MPPFDLNQALKEEEEGNQPEAILFSGGGGHHDRKANHCAQPPQQEETRLAGKRMPSETRLVRKMIDSNGEIIRVCSDCNTTKTPLWRSGPNGPKSLCNACGIRQRKARRVMAGVIPPPPALPTNLKDRRKEKKKKGEVYRSLPLKKQFKLTSAGKLCFDDNYGDAALGSRNNRSATREQRDAAVLLMTLSCGLILS
ncbi:protein CYTOKININ-RESPONSIVE GATA TRANSCRIPTION FACTOR 1-like [Zingiber officinale]|nr:protein CYTOKININ-RESPONSIVE GATA TRANSCRIPTION FACTOR 1-like [Zingiber officinale]